MGIEFNYPTKASPTISWVPSKQPQFPFENELDSPDQIVLEMADRTIRTQDKGPEVEKFTLKFDRITKTDRDSFRAFWQGVKKTKEKFEFQDHLNIQHSVRIMNAFNFNIVSEGRYSGEIELRKEVP